MCDGVEIDGKQIIFGEARDPLPTIRGGEEVNWIIWGERREGDCYPYGGWVHPDDLKARSWKPWDLKEAVIPAGHFMVRDQHGQAIWFPLESGAGIRGMMACRESDCRLYIVTTNPPKQYGWARRWPDIVSTQHRRASAAEPGEPSQDGQSESELLHA